MMIMRLKVRTKLQHSSVIRYYEFPFPPSFSAKQCRDIAHTFSFALRESADAVKARRTSQIITGGLGALKAGAHHI